MTCSKCNDTGEIKTYKNEKECDYDTGEYAYCRSPHFGYDEDYCEGKYEDKKPCQYVKETGEKNLLANGFCSCPQGLKLQFPGAIVVEGVVRTHLHRDDPGANAYELVYDYSKASACLEEIGDDKDVTVLIIPNDPKDVTK